MGRVLVFSFTDHARDPRVHRQLQALTERHEPISAGFGPPLLDVDFVDLRPESSSLAARANSAVGLARMLARRFEAAYWGNRVVRRAVARLESMPFDVVVSNDVETLPLALRLAAARPVVFDAHEYYPEHFADRWWQLTLGVHLGYLCRTYIPRASSMITVSPGIARRYREELGVDPTVVMNLPERVELEPSPVSSPVRLVHHGAADRRRHLETMIEAMGLVEGEFTLDFALVGDPREVDRLRLAAGGDERISFVAPVPMPELPEFLNGYDAGVYLLAPRSFNQRHALPNKLFEFIQARIGVVIGPSPDMAAIVRERGLGVVAADFTPQAFARAIASLDAPGVARLKARSHEAAGELHAEAGRQELLRLVEAACARASP
jgi:glycosyltransferase involved in cell wall biosynthesis